MVCQWMEMDLSYHLNFVKLYLSKVFSGLLLLCQFLKLVNCLF